jgi:hypothetical protein
MKSRKQNSPILWIFLATSVLFLVWLIRDIEFLSGHVSTASPDTVSTQTITEGATPLTDSPPVEWLNVINRIRKQSGLPTVRENESWSKACELHSQYMVKNDTITHIEKPGNLWYTLEGAVAAQNSNVMGSSDTRSPDEDAIRLWMSQPFHGIGILDPQLETIGFGSYREDYGKWKMAASLDVVSGNTNTETSENAYPIFWPPNEQTTTILSFDGDEWPNPLTSCPGYKTPTGSPIYLQIGSGSLTPNVTASSFQKGNQKLDHCIFDETNYANPGPSNDQVVGRSSLNARDAIIIIPRKPLKAGSTYKVMITVNEKTYTWSFTAQQ